MRCKRVSRFCFVVLGLLSIALHASVPAWHPFARSRTQLTDQQLAADLGEAICHGGRVGEPTEFPADRRVPDPKADCLFCYGFANISLAIPAGTEMGPPIRRSAHIKQPAFFRAVAAAAVFAPRSRGPPYLA